MDRSLLKEAIVANNIEAFTQIVQQNPRILQHTRDNDVVVVVDGDDDHHQSSNTALHLATRHGHVDLVAEILRRCPEMVGAENNKGETALHEACRLGHDKILAKLLETDPWVAPKLNFEGQSALYLACHHGRFKAAAIFLNQPWLQEQDDNDTFLHAAVAEGHIAIVRKVLETHPSAAQKLDKDGNSPLHCACKRGHAEITAMVLRHDPSLASGFNKAGYAPVHLSAVDGSTKVLKELFTMAPDCFQLETRMGETLFHLTTKFDRLDAFLYLTHVVNSTGLLNQPDKNGVTCLQLAVSLGHDKIAKHIMEEVGEEIDSVSTKNFLKEMLETSDAKRSTDPSSSTETTDLLTMEVPNLCVTHLNQLSAEPKEDNIADSNQTRRRIPWFRLSQERERRRTYRSEMRQYKHQSDKNRENLMKTYQKQHTRQEVYREALHNSRGSITQVAILIATVTYTSGINPPGGVYQDGPLRGTAVAARQMPFKVFTICNNAALFTSLCIVVVLISIIPFRRRPLMAMLMVAHKAMWVAIGFLATAYFAAALVIMPSPAHGSRMDWTVVSLLTISAGTLGSVFVGLGIMLARHHWKKMRHFRKKMSGDHSGHRDQDVKTDKNSDIFEGDENNAGKNGEEESINSDMDISMIEGHHPF